MFDGSRQYTGTGYTKTVAFLVVAFIFIPAVSVVSRPLGYVSVSLAIVCSAVCVSMAWVTWRKSSQLSIPSITSQGAK